MQPCRTCHGSQAALAHLGGAGLAHLGVAGLGVAGLGLQAWGLQAWGLQAWRTASSTREDQPSPPGGTRQNCALARSDE